MNSKIMSELPWNCSCMLGAVTFKSLITKWIHGEERARAALCFSNIPWSPRLSKSCGWTRRGQRHRGAFVSHALLNIFLWKAGFNHYCVNAPPLLSLIRTDIPHAEGGGIPKSPGSLLGEIPITGNLSQQGLQKESPKRHPSAQEWTYHTDNPKTLHKKKTCNRY